MQIEANYRNPVLRGFNPDPSIVRVGDWYYLATSSFQYFPAIPLYRSADLVEWEPIAHAIDREDQLDLRGIEDSHGIWAPDLSFHDGRFHLFATLRLNGNAAEAPSCLIRRQLVLTAERAEGPWSDPAFIDIDGIDPSLFVDDDGSSWMLLEPGVRLFPLSADRTRVAGEGRTVWPGTGERCPEGPRVFKRNGWYYAMLAEGGTGYGHRISVARSRSLSGPYEECPHNPVLIQRDTEAALQRAGHGQLVQTPAGEWWCVYLCGRRNGGNYTTLGRETALDPVEWTDDGWFTINGGRGPSAVQRRPALPRPPSSHSAPSVPSASVVDRFASPELGTAWMWARNPRPFSWRLGDKDGGLVLMTGNEGLSSIHIDNLLLRRETETDYEASCVLAFDPLVAREEAGLVAYIGFANWISCCITRREDGSPSGGEPVVRLVACRNGVRTVIAQPGITPKLRDTRVGLKTVVRGQRREFFWSPAASDEAASGETASGETALPWLPVGEVPDARFLSGEEVKVGKAHTGTLVGLYATNGGTLRRAEARFGEFSYRA